MALPLLTLTTDFGLSDHYAAAMKGVIYSICPRARIVDISHEVTPFAISEGAYLIAQAYACFPPQTVHVAVVDPGVGSDRRAILMEAAGQYFVGPDNGIFTLAMARRKYKVRELENPRYFRHPVSHTFHGRDIFAPAAAHLASGVAPSKFGPILRHPVLLDFERSQVLHIDRFGNIVTSLRAADYAGPLRLRIGGKTVTTRAAHYAEVKPGRLFVIEGSSGYLEISMNLGRASDRIRCRPGDSLTAP